jgi:hypothetical protein
MRFTGIPLFFGVLAVILFGISCKRKPDLTFPSELPFESNMPEQDHTFVCPCFDAYGNRLICTQGSFALFPMAAGTYNEFYSVTRWDSLRQDSVRVFWNKEYYGHLNCLNPTYPYQADSLFCPPQFGEVITIYRFQCNRSKDDFEFETEHTSMMLLHKQDGIADEIDTSYSEHDPIPGKTCVPVMMKIRYGGVANYVLRSSADIKNVVVEEDETNNELYEPDLANLNSGE